MLDRREPISVCLAVYNGAAYLRSQVESILAELDAEDELLAWDDCSTDDSAAVIERFADPRIVVHRGLRNQGVNRTFESLLGLARHNLIFMADQDDVWLPGRVDAMIGGLQTNQAWLVSSNTGFIDNHGSQINHENFPLRAPDSNRCWNNIAAIFRGRIGYYGCAMVLRRQLFGLVLPFPRGMESHDLWIAMCANLAGRNCHLECDTLNRRIHGENASVISRSFYSKIRSRLIFSYSLLVALARRFF